MQLPVILFTYALLLWISILTPWKGCNPKINSSHAGSLFPCQKIIFPEFAQVSLLTGCGFLHPVVFRESEFQLCFCILLLESIETTHSMHQGRRVVFIVEIFILLLHFHRMKFIEQHGRVCEWFSINEILHFSVIIALGYKTHPKLLMRFF